MQHWNCYLVDYIVYLYYLSCICAYTWHLCKHVFVHLRIDSQFQLYLTIHFLFTIHIYIRDAKFVSLSIYTAITKAIMQAYLISKPLVEIAGISDDSAFKE